MKVRLICVILCWLGTVTRQKRDRQNRDRHKRNRQNLERQNRDKLRLVVDNVESCVKSPKILHVHIILRDSPPNFGHALWNLARYRSRDRVHGDRPRELGDPVRPAV